MRSAIYPGTFDPVTLGHLDLVVRALGLFDRVIVAVAKSGGKDPLFPQEDRVKLFAAALGDLENVEVTPFEKLTVEFAKERGAVAIIRGLRAVSDFDYEFQLAWMNRKLDSSIETVFLCPNEHYSFLNSTLVKEIARMGRSVQEFVPDGVEEALRIRYGHSI
ncbi:MAG: pantetheine-phosphate adenylyltransferase [Gemmatimonadota bacterium]|nr:pantetheine-phosphate adenylyltransferase [Gemmatimonadota bacterium]MDP6460245.1 pantetheine-phosphate adenylyltransferase [Gemmatimonadota bacterium]MDP6529299.1 pantetheine-phosphate adenylyltransferase [Gemmatimonadota bacterium]MDP6802184.1 pantetheine-phosphate adenylyltransferase [Gemmatimonadota bacterium]MDP7031514.1 pantetheine-phosphate adenylyltransferase [Gemmatimonadota bacterium]